MKKNPFANWNLALIAIITLQIVISIFRLYFEILDIKFWIKFYGDYGFSEIQFSLSKIFLNFLLPFFICFIGLFGAFKILRKKRIGLILSLIFWISFLFFFLSILPLNTLKVPINYLYLLLIFGSFAFIITYLFKKLSFKTHR